MLHSPEQNAFQNQIRSLAVKVALTLLNWLLAHLGFSCSVNTLTHISIILSGKIKKPGINLQSLAKRWLIKKKSMLNLNSLRTCNSTGKLLGICKSRGKKQLPSKEILYYYQVMIHFVESLSDSCSVPSHGMLSLDKSHFFPSKSAELCQLQQAQREVLSSPQKLGGSAEESSQQHKSSANCSASVSSPCEGRTFHGVCECKANFHPRTDQAALWGDPWSCILC